MTADNFIVKKSASEFREVLAPKVEGTYHLDQATRDIELDFFVLFSSVAGAMGNVGQADYATANAFMDHFAAYRNSLVAAKTRRGQTRSINWTLWQAGGMNVAEENLEAIWHSVGMRPMQTETGMETFYRSLALPCDQILVTVGNREKIRSALLSSGPAMLEPPVPLFVAIQEYRSTA